MFVYVVDGCNELVRQPLFVSISVSVVSILGAKYTWSAASCSCVKRSAIIAVVVLLSLLGDRWFGGGTEPRG